LNPEHDGWPIQQEMKSQPNKDKNLLVTRDINTPVDRGYPDDLTWLLERAGDRGP
jgi:hypothetical protein